MAFRIRDLLIAVSPVDVRGIPRGLPNVADDCSQCTGLTKDCPGCSRIQCSDYPTRNHGIDFTIYEAVEDFRAAELLLLKAEMKLVQQRTTSARGKAAAEQPDEDAELEQLERSLTEALKEVRTARAKKS